MGQVMSRLPRRRAGRPRAPAGGDSGGAPGSGGGRSTGRRPGGQTQWCGGKCAVRKEDGQSDDRAAREPRRLAGRGRGGAAGRGGGGAAGRGGAGAAGRGGGGAAGAVQGGYLAHPEDRASRDDPGPDSVARARDCVTDHQGDSSGPRAISHLRAISFSQNSPTESGPYSIY